MSHSCAKGVGRVVAVLGSVLLLHPRVPFVALQVVHSQTHHRCMSSTSLASTAAADVASHGGLREGEGEGGSSPCSSRRTS